VRLILPRLVRSKSRVAVLVVALAVVGGGTAWAVSRDDAAAVAATTTAAATISTVEDTITATGTLRAARQAELTFSASGTVTTVTASVGQVVKAGQVLATIDAAALRRAVATAEASVNAAQESLESVVDADASDTQIAAADSQLAAAQADLDNARDALAGASLTATIDGTVAEVGLAVGDRVGTSSSAPSGATQTGGAGGPGGATSTTTTTQAASSGSVTVLSTDAFVVDASVGSADLARLKTGLQARITPTGATEQVFGTVSSVGVVATSSTTGAASFPVVVDVTGNPDGLYAGGGVSVVIVVSQTPDVLTVPTQAITTKDDGTTVVRKVGAGAEVETAVSVGTSYGPSTQITEGLAEGDTVALPAAAGGAGQRGAGGGQGGGGQGRVPGGGFPAGGLPGGGQRPAGGFPGGGAG